MYDKIHYKKKKKVKKKIFLKTKQNKNNAHTLPGLATCFHLSLHHTPSQETSTESDIRQVMDGVVFTALNKTLLRN